MIRNRICKAPPGWPIRDGTKVHSGKLGLLFTLLILVFTSLPIWAGEKPVQSGTSGQTPPQPNGGAAKPQVSYKLDWYSINNGGATFGSGGALKLGYTIGQSAAGGGVSGSNRLGIGFWHGACVAVRGDMNNDGIYTAADVVLMLNCTFSGIGSCDICFADVNCDDILTAADVVAELNRAFLGSTAPPWCGL